ncbi:hypothetical protein [Burkholderia cenocepacia]|uniref:hypothetical protein n=1 Tax=Burkholderia cenocepacia TaxID=95486 RepID=UPI002018DF46|nr:hypothetical protein [Burkholderia cenocepacia]MCO1396423.1 hypothetical protein [Burkholderia cenocepacia]MCO1408997.1 hypothetical protein [Burkholderia cenocepacia]UQN92028.1 hypothetical protein L0Z06_15010 [Burkholderia cenocepacia]UQN99177.1 hypothetical protein L0Z39_16800 [Burkholderia cenocepacia]UQP50868.1 hypothetical protein L0Y99_10445 [Burkholderia cenocepacia]
MATNFSGAAGFLQNPLIATLPPDQQQNLLQLQQRQAVGQALLAQGLQPADYGGANVGGLAYHVSPLNGIAKLVNAYVGNKLSMDSMGQQAQLMSQMWGPAFGLTQGGANAAPTDGGQAIDMPPPGAADTAALQGPSAGMGLTQPTPVQLGQAMGAQPNSAPQSTARGALQLPGMTPQQSMALYSMVGPEGYARIMAQWGSPTDATRMAIAAGQDPAPVNAAAIRKNFSIDLSPNSSLVGPDGSVTTTPAAAPAGYQNIKGSDGNWYTVAVGGGPQAVEGSRAADAAGAARYAVRAGVNQDTGKPAFTTDYQIANSGGGPGSGNLPGGGPVNAGRFGGYSAPNGGTIAPSLPAGAAGAAEKVAGANADRYNTAVQFGVDSPTRQNVLDNIIDLSKSGVATGPDQNWINTFKGQLADSPILGAATPAAWKDNVSGFTEIKKFITQNGQRAWQAAGGTGTDSQLTVAENANPNDKMFPQALQHMAQWAKAGELAGTARANFLQQFKNNNSGSVANLDQAEQTWRSNFDPKVFQLSTYDPAAQQQLINSLSPQQAKALMTKRAWFKQNGLLP